jgi:hypothetical protein
MRSLISSIGFSSFAFTYDTSGRPVRAIILEALPQSGVETNPAEKPAVQAQPLTTTEKDQLTASLRLWGELKDDARGQIEARLRSLPPSEDREEMLKEYGRRVLEAKTKK